MADFSKTANTGNNPDEWFSSSYAYIPSTGMISLNTRHVMSSTGVSGTDLAETTGDVRSVYLALAEVLYRAYDAKDNNAGTTSGRLKMTRSRVVDAPNNIRYSTYTIHVQEDGTASGGSSYSPPSFTSTGVRAE